MNLIMTADARSGLSSIAANSIDLSFWSPPYFVGKPYEKHLAFGDWCDLLREVIELHHTILKPGGFLAVNIADILCFQDPKIPSFQSNNVHGKKVSVTRDQITAVLQENPRATRYELARILGCSEQTIQRRLENNNVRGGKHSVQTKVLLTGHLLTEWAENAELYLYDRRVWHKDPCWANSRWHSTSYRAIDEFEYVYIFWKPGIVQYDRSRITANEWAAWGSRGVWNIPSVRQNGRHPAEFPEELARRVIRLFSPESGTVLDPFVGSGTTTAVAKSLNRKWIGIDFMSQYSGIARKRTNDT